jgi:hypothetical protein
MRQDLLGDTFIAGISGVAVTGPQVVVNANGKLGVAASSARFKKAIKPMDHASQAIHRLESVTFRYNEELDHNVIPQFGLVAEEVEKVNADLVVRDEEGKTMTVRYEAVNAILLNEFLKEHRKVEEQGATIAQQQKQIEELAANHHRVSPGQSLCNRSRSCRANLRLLNQSTPHRRPYSMRWSMGPAIRSPTRCFTILCRLVRQTRHSRCRIL